jgi:predicted peptidase
MRCFCHLWAGVLMAMVVISPVVNAAEETMAPENLYEAHTLDFADGDEMATLPYRLLRPAVIEEGERMPLVVFLHGAGERGNDNLAQLKYFPTWMASDEARANYPCYLLAPQCRRDKKWADYSRDPMEGEPLGHPLSADLAAVVNVMEQLLDDEPIDADRVYLTGLSMGGFGSWDLASRMPGRFAAMMPICGGGDPRLAEKYLGLPIWCFHGGADSVVKPERSRSMVEAILAAGGGLTYTEFGGVGHDSWTPAYQDPATLVWLFEQVRKR